jgi:hypothetical protein
MKRIEDAVAALVVASKMSAPLRVADWTPPKA